MATPMLHEIRKEFVASLWLGVLGSALVWAVHLQVLYALVKVANRVHSRGWLCIITLFCAAIVMVFCALSVRDWRRIRPFPDKTDSSSDAGRQRFLSLLGILSSGFFALTILATGVAVLFLKPNWM